MSQPKTILLVEDDPEVGIVTTLRLQLAGYEVIRSETLAGATVGAGLKAGEPALKTLVGQVGVALTPLRPAGRAEFGDRLVDVVTEGGFVERGTSVEAVAVQGRQVTVKVHKEA